VASLSDAGATMRRLTGGLLAIVVLVVVGTGVGYVAFKTGQRYERNWMCCQTPERAPNLWLSMREVFGLVQFYSQIGQDRWVLETVFPDVKDGFFLDVGSGDGTVISNTKALEERGWRGICIDPFPKNMDGRTCQMLKEVGIQRSREAHGVSGLKRFRWDS
jgi:hypothetical protein